jgi:3-hydroxybutyryl-CoA dehydrogenase
MRYSVQQAGDSRSFPAGDAFLMDASTTDSDVLVLLGASLTADTNKKAILIELASECLIEHLDEANRISTNVLGFCRYRNGFDAPTKLVELVRLPTTKEDAVDAARAIFEGAGLTVVVCTDQPGRILDRLLCPKYNAALRFLDEGLATAEDIDKTCRLGLGYPDGPIERVVRGGLGRHYDLTQALFETFGTPAYAPPPRAIAQKRRRAN